MDINNKPLCYAPFTQILLSPTGDIHPCCFHFGFKLGKSSQSFESIWNGPKIKKLREDLLNGDGKICRSRMHNLACQKNFSRWDGQVSTEIHQIESPKRLDVRLNGKCNLKCIMCDVWKQPNGLYDESFFWKNGDTDIFPFLKEIEILGGEPFIQQDTFRLISKIKSVNPECLFSFISNGQIANFRAIERALEDIAIRKFHLSIDSFHKETYRTIRINGDFPLLMINIEKYRELFSKPKFIDTQKIMSQCIVQQNWQEAPEFIDRVLQLDWVPELQFAYYDPSEKSSLLHLSQVEKERILDFYSDQAPHYQPYLEPIKTSLRQILSKEKPEL